MEAWVKRLVNSMIDTVSMDDLMLVARPVYSIFTLEEKAAIRRYKSMLSDDIRTGKKPNGFKSEKRLVIEEVVRMCKIKYLAAKEFISVEQCQEMLDDITEYRVEEWKKIIKRMEEPTVNEFDVLVNYLKNDVKEILERNEEPDEFIRSLVSLLLEKTNCKIKKKFRSSNE